MTDILVDLRADAGTDFDSESIDIVGYDRESKTLYVEFQSSGTVYSYENVEESTYNLFIGADSLNAFWRDHITGKHTSGPTSEGVITPREEEDPATTTNAEYEPLVPVGDPWGLGNSLTINNENSVITFPNVNITVPKRRFGIRWGIPGTAISSEPVYEAESAEAALRDFQKDAQTFLGDTEVKIKAVVHYFD